MSLIVAPIPLLSWKLFFPFMPNQFPNLPPDEVLRPKIDAKLQRMLNPDGVLARKKGNLKRRVYYAAGPNEAWCYDGHDKLVKYGAYVLW